MKKGDKVKIRESINPLTYNPYEEPHFQVRGVYTN